MDELNCPKTPIRLHQICIGGENVGKIWGVWEKEKVLQVIDLQHFALF